MEIFCEELSLFDRDLLPVSVAGPLSYKYVSFDNSIIAAVGEGWSSPPPVVGDADSFTSSDAVLFPDLLSPASPPEDPDFPNVSEPDWLDTKTNLLDFFDDAGIISQQPVTEALPTPVTIPVTDMSAISEHLNKIGYEIVRIQSPQEADKADNNVGLEMSLLDVVNNLAGSLEDNSSVLTESLEQSQLLEEDQVLSPISLEEVEDVLSSHPVSPSSYFDDSGFVDDSIDDPSYSPGSCYSPGPTKASGRCTERSAPYYKRSAKTGTSDRKERKKQQNKDAALRYRMKKKAESKDVEGECAQLEAKNQELKDKVDGLSREINYLKELMTEVYKAKGLKLPSLLNCGNI